MLPRAGKKAVHISWITKAQMWWGLSAHVCSQNPAMALHQGWTSRDWLWPLLGKVRQQSWASRTQPWLFIRVDIQGLAVTRCRGRSISRAQCGPLSQVYLQNLLLCATHWRGGHLHSEMSPQTGSKVFGFQVCKVPSRTPCFHFWQGQRAPAVFHLEVPRGGDCGTETSGKE